MSKDRSFRYMTDEELLAKRTRDAMRLQILDPNRPKRLDPNQRIGSLEEETYRFWHTLTSNERQKNISYVRDQLRVADDEIARRELDEVWDPHEEVVRFANEPLTREKFQMAQDLRHDLRKQRLVRMAQDGESLSVEERYAAFKGQITDAADTVAERFGSAKQAFRRNLAGVVLGTLATSAAVTGFNWLQADRAYQPVRRAYCDHIDFGCSVLEIKRTVPEYGDVAIYQLTGRPEITIPLEDGDITIPEKLTNPTGARNRMGRMIRIISENTSRTLLDGYEELTEADKTRIQYSASNLENVLEQGRGSLFFASPSTTTLSREIGLVADAQGDASDIADVFERHMSPRIVERENEHYARVKLWKYTTIGLGLLFGLALKTFGGEQRSYSNRRKNFSYLSN